MVKKILWSFGFIFVVQTATGGARDSIDAEVSPEAELRTWLLLPASMLYVYAPWVGCLPEILNS